MRVIKIIHSVLGVMPFIWFLSFLLILIIGIINFGYIPIEGNPVDPYSLGLDPLSLFITWSGILAFLSFYAWIALSVVLLVFFRRNFSFNRTATILFIIGVSGFFVFKYLFPGVFGWVLD